MKKFILSILAICLFGAGSMLAQSPEAINYQGVARDATGNPIVNQSVGLRFSIRSGSANGTLEYQETHTVTTSSLGLFNLKIGQGTAVSGTFSAISWSANSHFLEVELDPNGGTNYSTAGNQELVSVPYALHATTVEIDQVDDADADPTNELQTLAGSGADVTLSNGGGTVTVDVDDADADPANELNTGAALNGNTLEITDAGGTLTVNLSTLAEDTTNELQTLSQSGSTVTLSDGGGSVSIDDADADPSNELQTVTQSGSTVTLSNSGGSFSIDDADADPSNELQTVTQSGSTVTLSNSGGSFSIDDADADPTNEIQTVTQSGSTVTLSNSGGSFSIDDADADPTNEIQTLTINNDTISLSGSGGQVVIPNDGDWTVAGNNIYSGVTGNVGISTTNPANHLHVVESSSLSTAAVFASGALGPTYGQLAVQGDTDHEGINSLDISGNEIGVLGISNGGSTGDNYGVYGHSNGWGGRFEYGTGTAASNQVYLGSSARAIQANGDIYVNNGEVGIRTAAPAADLHIKQSYSGFPNPTTGGIIFEEQGTTERWQVWNSSNFLSFAWQGTRVAYVNNASGAWTTTSDRNFKKNIADLGPVMAKVMQLEPVKFNYKHQSDADAKITGFIAQDVQKLFPEVVSQDASNGPLAISYSEFGVISIKAIQEQQAEIEAQNTRIEKLEAEIEVLKQMIRESNK